MEKEILNFDEAAKYLGFSKSMLYKMTAKRIICFYKPSGKLIYFKKEDLDNWLLSNRITPQSEIEETAQAYCMGNKKGGAHVSK
ncbi:MULTISPECIES: helix-turn-helix domain-containing protein [unclassified Dysgonomonas]|uniref:helix-turn-helix domain-containing protein n=1 Tax=unclassified Dysgonomonas TaxID=2630389 RepID=UPI0025B8C8B5|nr:MULTISPECIES: helix-turn-helix domain-containing protein [unclassified Dysgonomonas]